MNNAQARLLGSAICLLAGAVVAGTERVDVNVGLVIIVVSGALFLAEYWRSR